MTNRLACELNDKIAAFASVGGTRASSVECDPDRGIPFLHIHGTADDVVDYTGESLFGSAFLASLFIGVDELIGSWVGNNSCIADIAAISVGENTEAYKYTACDDQSEVWLYKVNGAGHEWYLTSDFSTPALIWEFFSQFEYFVGIKESGSSPISVYPNPTTDRIQISGAHTSFTFELLDQNGRVVLKGMLFPGESINVAELPKGLYMLRLSNETIVHSEKLIIR